MSMFYKPFNKNQVQSKLLKEVSEQKSNQLINDLNETFTLIGEEFKSIKNCKLYKFFVNLSDKDQDKIIKFLANILKKS